MRRMVWIGIGLFAGISCSQAQTASSPSANGPGLSNTDIRELVDAAKATAKATRENVDYIRVVPDVLYQILAKLDKVEAKLDKIETELKRRETRR